MAVRVSIQEVNDILPSNDLGDNSLASYIKTANIVVNDVFDGDTSISSALLIEIEKYYAAHLASSTKLRQTMSESVGDASVKYTGKTGLGLDSTTYGQMVKQIDTSGKMEAYTGKRKANIYAIKSFEIL